MTDRERRYALNYRADLREDAKVRYHAALAGQSREEWLIGVLARAIRDKYADPPQVHVPERTSEKWIRRVAERTADGEDTTQIATAYGTTPDHVRRIRDGLHPTDRSTRP